MEERKFPVILLLSASDEEGVDIPGGGFKSQARATSSDGSIVVGEASTAEGRSAAFIWDAAHGMRSIGTLLVDTYGIDLSEWILIEAHGISEDGRVIVGRGSRLGDSLVAALPKNVGRLCEKACGGD